MGGTGFGFDPCIRAQHSLACYAHHGRMCVNTGRIDTPSLVPHLLRRPRNCKPVDDCPAQVRSSRNERFHP